MRNNTHTIPSFLASLPYSLTVPTSPPLINTALSVSPPSLPPKHLQTNLCPVVVKKVARVLLPTTQNHVRQRLLHALLHCHRGLPPARLPHLRLDMPGVYQEEGHILSGGVAGPDTEDWREESMEVGRVRWGSKCQNV